MLEISKTQGRWFSKKFKFKGRRFPVPGSTLLILQEKKIQQVSLVLGLDESFLNNSLDADESCHVWILKMVIF